MTAMKRVNLLTKRPCRECKRWFMPDARPGDRQKICGNAAFKRECPRHKCADWNRKNAEYGKANALQRKIETAKDPAGSDQQASLAQSRGLLPLGYAKEVIQEGDSD